MIGKKLKFTKLRQCIQINKHDTDGIKYDKQVKNCNKYELEMYD